MTKKTAWGYVRLSQESDASIDEQKQSIREYAHAHDLDLATTRNEGQRTSGFNNDRDEYRLAKEKVNAAEVDAIITRDRARMSRDFDERLNLITIFRTTGVEWHVVEEGGRLHLEDVQRAGMECMHAMMDHVKKMVEIERSKEAIKKRREKGCYQGKPPMGLKFADDGCHLEKSDEWEVVGKVLEMTMSGDPQSYIAERTGLAQSSISAIQSRGFEWYEEKLDEYGT